VVFKRSLWRYRWRSRNGGIPLLPTGLWLILQVQLNVHAEFVSDVLEGDDRTEMQITFNRYIEEEAPAGDD
jgi:hypothetical protein